MAVLRTIPGDDSGEVDELVLLISSEFIREQDLKGLTRVKWFLHRIEQLDMVGRVSGGVTKSQHVLGDKVKCALLFNTVKRDSRERVYTMSETGYSTLMALAGPVLESSASASAAVPSLQCVSSASQCSVLVGLSRPTMAPGETKTDTQGSPNTPTKYTGDSGVGSPSTPTRNNRSTTSSTSLYSPTKKRLDALDAVSIDEDSSVFRSCQEDTDTSLVEDTDIEQTSVSTIQDLSNTLSHLSGGESLGASPVTVKSQTSTPLGASPLTLAPSSQLQPPASPEPAEPISPISWNYSDYSMADHRVQLYCELSLFREEEDLLLLAKGCLRLSLHQAQCGQGYWW